MQAHYMLTILHSAFSGMAIRKKTDRLKFMTNFRPTAIRLELVLLDTNTPNSCVAVHRWRPSSSTSQPNISNKFESSYYPVPYFSSPLRVVTMVTEYSTHARTQHSRFTNIMRFINNYLNLIDHRAYSEALRPTTMTDIVLSDTDPPTRFDQYSQLSLDNE